MFPQQKKITFQKGMLSLLALATWNAEGRLGRRKAPALPPPLLPSALPPCRPPPRPRPPRPLRPPPAAAAPPPLLLCLLNLIISSSGKSRFMASDDDDDEGEAIRERNLLRKRESGAGTRRSAALHSDKLAMVHTRKRRNPTHFQRMQYDMSH